MKKLFYLILFLFIAYYPLAAQHISLFDIDTSSFPIMKAKMFAMDADGKQISDLKTSDLSLTENGIPREIISISCLPINPAQRISSTIVIDVSGSMGGLPLDIAKTVAKTWVNALPLGQSDCALVSFNGSNYFNQDFTTNRNKLLSAIDGLSSDDGTDYNAAMINPVAGGILTAKTGKHKKVIVFITDGLPNNPPDEARIIAEANANDIMIHCITIGLPAHTSMVHFAEQTGGLLFENVRTEEKAKSIAQMLLGRSVYDFQPCELQWKSEIACERRFIDIAFNWKSSSVKARYYTPESGVAKLVMEPTGLKFINKPIGKKADTTVSITAINADFNISRFVCSDPKFSITPKGLTILKGETKDVILSFTPIDSSLCCAYIDMQTDKCTKRYIATSSYPKSNSHISTLRLTYPNGGEEFLVGTDTLITWDGVLTDDKVKLEYSYNKGATWNLIVDGASGLKYVWKNVPRPTNTKCLVRISTKNNGVNIEWEKIFGGSHDDVARDIFQTINGYIVIGSTVSFDGEVGNNYENTDVWALYLNNQGEPIWKKRIGGSSSDIGFSVIEMEDGSFVIGAITYSDEIQTPKGHQSEDYWIIKLDINGNIIWSKRYGGWFKDELCKIIKTNDGGILAVGFSNSNDGDVSGNHGNDDAWIVKLDPDGNLEWQKSFGGTEEDFAYSVAQTTDNCFVIAGFSESKDGDIPKNQGQRDEPDCWVAKLSSDGSLLWSKTFGGEDSDVLFSIKETQDLGFIVSGSSNSNNGDVSGYRGKDDALVAKLDSNGNIQWIKMFGGSDEDYAASVIETGEGDFLFVGPSSSNDYDVQYTPIEKGLCHFWMVNLDYAGQINWWKILNENYMDRATSVQQTNDGSYIAAGIKFAENNSSDVLVIKFSPEQSPQSDVSDSVFSIVSPTLASWDIDMGKVILGAYKDSLITSFIENKSKFECKIKDIRLTGADAADFYVISNKQFTLAGGEKKAIEFHFKPGAIGPRNAQIEIESQDSILTQSITGEGVQPQIQLSTKLIDFGVVEVNQSKDTVLFLIKNLDKDPITITDTKLLGPDFKQFNIVSGGGAFTLQPDSLRELKLAFNPVYIGRTSSDIGFYFNGPGSPARAQLFGRGIGGAVYCTEDSAAAGERVTINLCLRNVKVNSVNKLASSFKALIQYEKSLLTPVNGSLLKSVGKDSAYLEIHGNIGKDSILYPIEFIAGLGANESTSIDISDFKWLDETGKEIEYETEMESGFFMLLGVCREGGQRLFNPAGKAEILKLAPNPARDEITVTVNKIEEGESFIVIYNSLGAEAERIALTSAPLGEKEIKISLASYPRGVYFIRFQTPTVSTGRMVIFD